jgi:hypothetical protein
MSTASTSIEVKPDVITSISLEVTPSYTIKINSAGITSTEVNPMGITSTEVNPMGITSTEVNPMGITSTEVNPTSIKPIYSLKPLSEQSNKYSLRCKVNAPLMPLKTLKCNPYYLIAPRKEDDTRQSSRISKLQNLVLQYPIYRFSFNEQSSVATLNDIGTTSDDFILSKYQHNGIGAMLQTDLIPSKIQNNDTYILCVRYIVGDTQIGMTETCQYGEDLSMSVERGLAEELGLALKQYAIDNIVRNAYKITEKKGYKVTTYSHCVINVNTMLPHSKNKNINNDFLQNTDDYKSRIAIYVYGTIAELKNMILQINYRNKSRDIETIAGYDLISLDDVKKMQLHNTRYAKGQNSIWTFRK